MITLHGLRELWKLHKEGLPLPDGWIDEARVYIEHKRWAVENLGGSAEMKTKREVQSKEAEAILYCLVMTKGGIYDRIR